MSQSRSADAFSALLEQIGDGVPDAAQYQRMFGLVLDFPDARRLKHMNPFSASYRQAAMELYLSVRGRPEQGYEPGRDEAPASQLPDDLWTGLVPWSFRDAATAGEHLHAWGHILTHLNLSPGGSVLEYGAGSGQILLMLSRMGYRACGVDIDPVALQGIAAQSAHLCLSVETEQAAFGDGFAGRKFDTIVFYEAFHHAFDFDALLTRLHDRLNPGGRIVLCGEPVLRSPSPAVPYPWGPRLDALSVFCIRRFGWMELGFTHDFLVRIAAATGWTATLHPFRPCSRATLYVLEPKADPSARALGAAAKSWRLAAPIRGGKAVLANGRRTLRKLAR